MSITIRHLIPKDIPQLLDIYNYYVDHSAITFATQRPSLEEFTKLATDITKNYPFLVALNQEQIVGYAYAHRLGERGAFDYSVELSIYLDHQYRCQGAGRALYEQLEIQLKAQGILNLYASIATPVESEDEYLTLASLKFHEKMGFTLVGTMERCGYKFGRFYSLTWVQKLIGEHLNHHAPALQKPKFAKII